MNEDSALLAMAGLRFFGQLTASLGHDIKNVLAIVNENAGLLQDLLTLGAPGAGPSAERLVRLAQALERQVARGDQLLRRLSAFAHSADAGTERLDVHALIAFVIDLTGRLIALRGQAPLLEPPAAPVIATTNRFFLALLIWACLERTLDACPPTTRITISAAKSAEAVKIRFQGAAQGRLIADVPFPSPEQERVGRMIGARITARPESGEIILHVT